MRSRLDRRAAKAEQDRVEANTPAYMTALRVVALAHPDEFVAAYREQLRGRGYYDSDTEKTEP